MKRYFTLLLVSMFGTGITQAHNPNEISYFFKLDDKELVIHLTPKSAIDILEKLHPQLKNQSSFSLQAYAIDFEAYFNKTIRFVVDDQPVSLALWRTDLNAHEATLSFGMNGIALKPKSFEVEVLSFVDIYRRAKNHVFVYSDDIKKHYLLDASGNRVSSEIQTTENQFTGYILLIFLISVLFMLLSIGFAVYRKQPTLLKPFHVP